MVPNVESLTPKELKSELDPARSIVCICHHGIRSAHAARALEEAGFQRVINLAGGIDRWSCDVDPRVPRYR